MKFLKTILLLIATFFPSKLRIGLLKVLGFKIDWKCKIGVFSLLLAEEIEIGRMSKIGSFSIVKCGKKLVLKEYAEIAPFVMIYGDSSLYMDSATYIGPRAVLNISKDITMGFYSAVGPGSYLYTHGVWLPYTDGYPRKFEPIILKPYSWVPARVFISPGIVIGENTIISPGQSIFKNIPDNVYYTGNTSNKQSVPISLIKNNSPVYIRIIDLLQEFNKSVLNNKVLSFYEDLDKQSLNATLLFNNKTYTLVVFKHDCIGINVIDNKKKNHIYFFPKIMSFEKITHDNCFLFNPLVCSKPKEKITKSLHLFFEKECGLRFGIEKALKQYYHFKS